MIAFYNWLVCKISKCFHLGKPIPKKAFETYCTKNPWERSCRIYED
ncbi:MAG: CP12 domain-containing protein [Gemmataceae bacterium]